MGDTLPLLPLLDRAYRVRREYATEVITNRDGSEQRRSLRQTPRKAVEFDTTIRNGRRLDFDRFMVRALRQELAHPELPRFATVSAAITATDTTAEVDAVPSWLVAGADVFLRNHITLAQATVDSIAGTTVTFTAAIDDDWPAGTLIHPALAGRLAAETGLATRYRVVDDVDVTFEVTPGSEPAEDEGAAAATFQNREVFLKQPNIWLPVTTAHEQMREAVDFGYGVAETFHPVAFTPRIRQGVYSTLDGEAAEELRAFFTRMKGRRNEFRMPTFEADLPLVEAAGSATQTLRVEGTDVATIYDGSSLYDAVAAFVDGVWRFRRVTGIAEDAGASVVTVSTVWGIDIPVTATVSWMPVWRLATDVFEAEWVMLRHATVQLTFQMLKASDAEVLA
jgi:hypothetical protein